MVRPAPVGPISGGRERNHKAGAHQEEQEEGGFLHGALLYLLLETLEFGFAYGGGAVQNNG